MHRFKLCIGILLVFALGALAGAVGTRLFLKHRITGFIRGGPPGGLILKRLSDELDLAESQRDEIEKIVAATEEKLHDFTRKYHPEFIGILDEGISLIKGQLDDQQKEELDALLEKMEHHMFRGALDMSVREDEITEGILFENKERLNLTREQEAGVRQVLEKGIRRRHEIVEKYTGKLPREMPSFMEQMRDRGEAIERDLGEILTAEQMREYKRLREEQRERMMKQNPPGHMEHPPQ